MSRGIILAGLLLILGTVVGLVVSKESTLADGRVVLLELAPVDPRSLMQGDYMILRYALTRDGAQGWPADGRLILAVDAHDVGTLRRVDDGRPLAEGEVALRYRVRRGSVRLGAESYFFQEGQAEVYDEARYGELRVAPDGNSVLVGLRDAQREILGPEARLH